MAVKRCSKCGSDTIMAKVIYGATVKSIEDGTFVIIQQGKKFEVEPVQCMHCKTLFEKGMEDLVEMQVCKTCGKPSLDIDANGECDICRTMKTRPELANMTTNDLIRMVLQLEKKAAETPQAVQLVVNKTDSGTTTSVEPMNPPVEESVPAVEEKSEITNTAAEKVAAAQQAIEQAQADASVETPKKKRAVRKKTSSTEENISQEETVKETVNPEPAGTIENAPLNDVDPFSANTTGFSMFDEPIPTQTPVEEVMPMPMFDDNEQAF
jgi:hypothetical protein